MRPDPVMDLVLLSAIMMGAIMLFVILWLLVRKYSIAPVAKPPRGEDTLTDVAPSQRRASKTSMQRAGGMKSASTGHAVSPALKLEARPETKTRRMTSLPSSDDNRPEINHGKAAAVIAPKQGELVTDTAKSRDCGPVRQEDGTNAQNKPKASSGLVIANAGDEGASKHPSKTNGLADDTYVAPTGADVRAVKTSSVEEQPGADGVKGTCEGQGTREETSVGTSVERTTAREQRHHKKFNKQHRDGGVSDGIGSETTAIPEAGCDADTTATKRKRKSRHEKDSRHTTGADGVVSNGLSSTEEHSHGGLLVPKSHSSSRRLSTKSRSSHKSATSGDARSDALTSPPPGWTSGQVPNVVAATAETAVPGDDDTFLSKLPEMDGRDVQPPTPPHPNTDVFSREHSSLIAAAKPMGAALTPAGESASGQITPNMIRSASGACKSPTPMKPSLMDISRERSPNMPASPHKTPTHPLPPHDET